MAMRTCVVETRLQCVTPCCEVSGIVFYKLLEFRWHVPITDIFFSICLSRCASPEDKHFHRYLSTGAIGEQPIIARRPMTSGVTRRCVGIDTHALHAHPSKLRGKQRSQQKKNSLIHNRRRIAKKQERNWIKNGIARLDEPSTGNLTSADYRRRSHDFARR
ncbi:hypothetical protein AVEN_163958-1 [Araneus ventricosus]|uniref:Uncharacterized protein n=1 Tax=Araneus ventricosus TaxID=182803 RepID=A0A4Y2WF54_ARAVE|nr:hypothetical protein AVEN_163958-1 [Araneus ventricosus]